MILKQRSLFFCKDRTERRKRSERSQRVRAGLLLPQGGADWWFQSSGASEIPIYVPGKKKLFC